MADFTTQPQELVLIDCKIELVVIDRQLLLDNARLLPGVGKALEIARQNLDADRPDGASEFDVVERELIAALQQVLLDTATNFGMELQSTLLEITDWFVKAPLFDYRDPNAQLLN